MSRRPDPSRWRQPDLEDVWKALANPVRRAILDLLRDGPRTTGALAGRFPELSRFAVMHELETGRLPLKTRVMYRVMGWFMFLLPKSTRVENVDELEG